MDIITHTLSGVLVGATAASFTKNTRSKIWFILAGTLGGCLPDIDAISLWSGFDDSFGKILKLEQSGHDIYFSKLWYSHHGFFHSMAAIIFYLLVYFMAKKIIGFITQVHKEVNINGCMAFSGGYMAHILEDLPTPSGSWGGVNLFWPSDKWIGGTGQTWWWNNYDICLIVLVSCCISLVLTFLNIKWLKTCSLIIFFSAFFVIIYQLNSRDFNFNSEGYGAKETISLDIQKKILGHKIFGIMSKMDDNIKINF